MLFSHNFAITNIHVDLSTFNIIDTVYHFYRYSHKLLYLVNQPLTAIKYNTLNGQGFGHILYGLRFACSCWTC